jgi:hypothetical protein
MMFPYFLAAANPVEQFQREVNQPVQKTFFSSNDTTIAIAVSVGIGLLLCIIVVVRHRRNMEKSERRRLIETSVRPSRSQRDDDEEGSGRRRRRKRRRPHRPRNPTLQDTGGLPPPRPDDELPKY